LTLGKIIKIVATRCLNILRLKCTKFNFGWGSAHPAWGAYSAPPDLIAGLRGPTSKGRGGDGKVREGEPRGGEGTIPTPSRPPTNPYFWIRPWMKYMYCIVGL